MSNDGETTRAPIKTTNATYVFGDFTVKMNEGEPREHATMRVSKKNNYEQRDARAQECVLTIGVADADDVIRLMQHALDHREERT